MVLMETTKEYFPGKSPVLEPYLNWFGESLKKKKRKEQPTIPLADTCQSYMHRH